MLRHATEYRRVVMLLLLTAVATLWVSWDCKQSTESDENRWQLLKKILGLPTYTILSIDIPALSSHTIVLLASNIETESKLCRRNWVEHFLRLLNYISETSASSIKLNLSWFIFGCKTVYISTSKTQGTYKQSSCKFCHIRFSTKSC